MVMKLETVVPFGRSLAEYRLMFDLSPEDLQKRSILGVGDGPASFNAEGNRQGFKIISVDPIYQFNKVEIKQRFDAVVDDIVNQIIATPDSWVWNYHKTPQDLKASRIETIETFLQDYDRGKSEGRYRTGELPQLNFKNRTFDLALCSHFLFLYAEQLDYNFHLSAIAEMLRVSQEVRIFPLLTLMQETYPNLELIIAHFKNMGYSVSIDKVPYEFQPGGNKMLAIRENQ